jgi:hypothetical protein
VVCDPCSVRSRKSEKTVDPSAGLRARSRPFGMAQGMKSTDESRRIKTEDPSVAMLAQDSDASSHRWLTITTLFSWFSHKCSF